MNIEELAEHKLVQLNRMLSDAHRDGDIDRIILIEDEISATQQIVERNRQA